MSMRTTATLAGLLALLSCGSKSADGPAATVGATTTYTSAHFAFNHGELDRATIAQTAGLLEAEYPRIVADLGGIESPRVHVWFYADHGDLERAVAPMVGAIPTWASGLATRRDQIHLMSPNAPAYQPYSQMIANLVHEFAHCVSLQRNGSIANNPRWFWESVAIYEAGQARDPKTLAYMTALTPPSFASLNSLDNTRIYEVGYTIGEFIVARWGKPALVALIQNNADIQATLGIPAPQLEAEWFAFVRQKYGF